MLLRIVEQADLPATPNRQTLMFWATFAPNVQFTYIYIYIHIYIYIYLG